MTPANMRPSIILIAYGEMGPVAFQALKNNFDILSVILPPVYTDTSAEATVQKLAEKYRVRLDKTNSNKLIEQLTLKNKPDALVICSYNKILPPQILDCTRCINVHHGDLPRWRGRANLNWAIITGRKKVGLTIHQAVADLDAGNIYAQYMIPITDTETIASLYEKVNILVKHKLAAIVQRVINEYTGKPQTGQVTYCCTRLPSDGYINWNQSSLAIDRLIRSLTHPYPGAFTFFNEKRLTIWSAEIPKDPRKYEGRITGRIILIHKNYGVEVLTGDSSLIIKDITYAGKNGKASDFINSVKTSMGINWVKLYESRFSNYPSTRKPRLTKEAMNGFLGL